MSKAAAYGRVRRRLEWERVPPNPNPCPECEGRGSYWPKRKDGKYERRHSYPKGPCRACDGTGVAA